MSWVFGVSAWINHRANQFLGSVIGVVAAILLSYLLSGIWFRFAMFVFWLMLALVVLAAVRITAIRENLDR